MKFGQSIEFNKTIIFLQNHTENVTERLFPDLFLLFKKALFEVKASGLQFSFNFDSPQLGIQLKQTM